VLRSGRVRNPDLMVIDTKGKRAVRSLPFLMERTTLKAAAVDWVKMRLEYPIPAVLL
jgi:hypothetical protein